MKKILLLVPAVLAGCVSNTTQTALNDYKKNADIVSSAQAQTSASPLAEATTFQRLKGVYLGQRSISHRNDLSLPDVFHQTRIFSVAGRLSFADAMSEISQKSGIKIRLASDVYKKEAGSTQPGIALNFTNSLKQILDQLCADEGVSWEYTNGIVTVARTVTRTFRLKSPVGSTDIVSNVGSSGVAASQGGSGIGSGFSSNTTVTNITRLNPIESIEKAVKAILSPTGKAVVTATNSIIVTDTADIVEKVKTVIESEDRVLARNAHVRVQIFSFTANEGDSAGVNWQALYQNINKFKFTISSPASVSNSSGGQFATQVLSPSGAPGHTDGSKVFFDLLAQRGQVSIVHDLNVPITNLNVYSVLLPRQQSYLSKTTPTPGTIAGTTPGIPGLESQTVTFGFKMSLYANILDSNTMRLKFNLGIIDLLDMRKLESGTGINLQSPDLAGFELPADMVLRPNQTSIVTSIEHIRSNYTRNGLTQDLPIALGGSYAAGRNSEKYFILITPIIIQDTL